MYANTIKSLGADDLKITQQFGQYKYHVARKSRSEPASIEKAPMVGEATEAETPEATTPVDTPDVTEETPETPKVDELLTVETPAPENPETPEVPTKAIAYSGYIGDSAVAWTFNAETGRLFISGSGYVEPFFSEDDRPWRELREKITSVRFDLASSMEITDLCYWFDGCINLSDAAIPVNVCQLCPEDFAVCPALNTLTYGGVDVLVEITMDYSNQAAYSEQGDADGGISLFSSSNCGVTRCTCTGSCSYGYRNYRVAPESNNYHIMTVYCATCGMTDGIIVSGNHSYSSNGYCSLCGYYNSAYDTSVCYHTSTYTTWSGCNWTKYCSNCGAYISSGTSHGSTYTTWNGCNWYEYCRDCGQLMDSGTSHSYSYGGWEYYNSSRHRRTGTCTSCGATTYSYGYHSTSTQYSQYSSTQHSYGSYCSTCASYVGSVSYLVTEEYEYDVQVPYTYYICTVTLENFNLSHVPVYIMSQDQLSVYAMYMATLGNRPDLFGDSSYVDRYYGGEYEDYDIPPEALEDEQFAAMIKEAEKYLGFPYVWGGSSPSTSFDCSGFASWVVNNCGVGWDVGRLGASGLLGICTRVSASNVQPGDLIFFQGTYDTTGASHVGIYVGGGMMMIDGIVNNGPKQPTVAELEQQAKSGTPISLMDLAAASHRERDADRKEKRPSVLAQLKSHQEKEKSNIAPKKSAEREL